MSLSQTEVDSLSLCYNKHRIQKWRAEHLKREKPLCVCLGQGFNNQYNYEPVLVSPECFSGCCVCNKSDYKRATFSLLLSEIKQCLWKFPDLHQWTAAVQKLLYIYIYMHTHTHIYIYISELSCSFISRIGLSTNHCIKNNMNLIVPFCFHQEFLPYGWQKGTILNGRIFETLPKFTFQFLTH